MNFASVALWTAFFSLFCQQVTFFVLYIHVDVCFLTIFCLSDFVNGHEHEKNWMSYSISSHLSFCVTILHILPITESESVHFSNNLIVCLSLHACHRKYFVICIYILLLILHAEKCKLTNSLKATRKIQYFLTCSPK